MRLLYNKPFVENSEKSLYNVAQAIVLLKLTK